MPAFPSPPERLPDLRPDDVAEIDGRVWRVYFSAGAYPGTWRTFRSYGPVVGGRFDHHEPPKSSSTSRAVLYGAHGSTAIETCLAEVFQGTRVIDRHDRAPYLAAFRLERPLRLLDLRDSWPARAGVTQIINSGSHTRAQAWSREIYLNYPDLDGMLYPSAASGISGANIMLYERAATALPSRPLFNEALSHTGLVLPLRRAAYRFGYFLL